VIGRQELWGGFVLFNSWEEEEEIYIARHVLYDWPQQEAFHCSDLHSHCNMSLYHRALYIPSYMGTFVIPLLPAMHAQVPVLCRCSAATGVCSDS